MVGTVVVVIFAIEPLTGRTVSGLAMLLCMGLAGSLITRLAARDGIKKTGLLGVGAKTVLLLALGWVAVMGMYLAVAFSTG